MACSTRFSSWITSLAVGLAYWAAATLSLWLTQNADGIASMWPPSGIMLATLIRWQGSTARRCILAAAIASVAANLAAGTSLAETLGYTFANMTEAMVAALIWRKLTGGRADIRDWNDVLRLCFAVIVAAVISAVMPCLARNQLDLLFAASWLGTVVLGMLIGTPVLLVIGSPLAWRGESDVQGRLLKTTSTLCLLSLVTAATFWQTHYPLLFLPLAALLVVTWRLRLLGASAGVLIIAVIGSILTAMSRGPIALMHASPVTESFVLQVYLLTLFATALPLAALLASHERLAIETIQTASELKRTNEMLADAEAVAGLGHWRYDRRAAEMDWSSGAARIHGWPSKPGRLSDLLSFYHPDDRRRIQSTLGKAFMAGASFKLEARIAGSDRATRHVAIIGRPIIGEDGEVTGLFGTVQDISDRVAIESQLQTAKMAAEIAAAEAIKLADLDVLTGVASRRRILADLDDAVEAARMDARGLSVILFDIDHFKRVNDRYGHATGDTVLTVVAQSVAAGLRPGDRIGRLGGEEFLVISMAAHPDDAVGHADRLREIIAEASQRCAHFPAVTASFGVATYDDGASSGSLLRAADEALYAAKAAGRDRVRLAA